MLDFNICCQRCSHKEVCSLKGEFEKAQKAVNDCSVSLGKTERGYETKYLYDFDYIERVELHCKHFVAIPNTAIRDVAYSTSNQT